MNGSILLEYLGVQDQSRPMVTADARSRQGFRMVGRLRGHR